MQYQRLLDIVKILRSEGGCPWDKAQTLESLVPFLIEESYELVDAILEGRIEAIKEELGDLALQLFMLSQIAFEQNFFSIEDVLSACSDKMVRRHPHVFGSVKVESIEDVLNNWDEIKRKESESFSEKSLKLPQIPTLLAIQKVLAKKKEYDFGSINDSLKVLNEFFSNIHLTERREYLSKLIFWAVIQFQSMEMSAEVSLRKELFDYIAKLNSASH